MQPIHIQAEPTPDTQSRKLALPASVGLAEIDALHSALIAHIASEAALIIDASEVDRASTPCIQLLVAAATAARANGLDYRIDDVPDKFLRAISDLGLCDVLGLAAA